MPGVVGRMKMTPKFDARGGRKGKTTPQIWCSGWSEGENDPPNLMLGVVGRVKRTPRFDARGDRKGKMPPRFKLMTKRRL